jgi:serine/threonine protein kinase
MEEFGQYLLLDRVACGGMAELFRAKQIGIEGFERVLAIKRILPHISSHEEFISMFIAEAKLVAHLSHKNIAQIYDFGKTGENYFIAMEYVKGKDLRELIKRCQEKQYRLPVELAVFIAKEVLSALGYAHKQKDSSGRELKLIHRDVSPQNILISYEGEVKVIDFGIAKAETQSHTKTGTIKGKLAYMSPEQAWGRPIDHRSDIFSLGIVLYELITGLRLFKGTTEINTLEKVREARVEPFSPSLVSITPPALETIVMKSLSKEVRYRYQDATDMEKDLGSILFELSSADPGILLKKFMNDLFREEIEAENRASAGDATQSIRYEKKPLPAPKKQGESRPPLQPGKKPEQKSRTLSSAVLATALLGLVIAVFLLLPNSIGEKISSSFSALQVFTDHDQKKAEEQRSVGEQPPVSTEQGAPPAAQPKEVLPESKDDPAEKETAPETLRGNLTVNAIPWADIYINEKHYGTTPKAIKDLKAGDYRVRLENPNYDIWKTKVAVKEGKTVTISHRFEGYGKIIVNALPWGNVYLNGTLKGQTPITLQNIPARVYEIRISREGYGDVKKTVALKTGATEFVSVKLEKEAQ